jgi:hypothetical protein
VKYGKYLFLWFCLMLAASSVSAQTSDAAKKLPTAKIDAKLEQLANPKIGTGTPLTSNGSKVTSPYIDGTARFLSLRGGKPAGAQARPISNAQLATQPGMPSWEGSFDVLGAKFPFIMIGTNPANGSATSKIPVMVIPLLEIFPDGTQLDPTQNACGDTKSPVTRIMQSPLFQTTEFKEGNTVVGNTQYMDAFQRANFWTTVSEKAPNYHIILSPTVSIEGQIVIVDPNLAVTAQGPCGRIAAVDIGLFDAQVQALVTELEIPANTLPVFVTYNSFESAGGSCCILGYHSVDGNNHPYVVAAYNDPNIFTVPIEDIHALSHELGEWLDDPFIRNFIPAWGNVGQVGGCSNALETGDAVTGTPFEVTKNGFTYHPEDLVFLPWFSRQVPSTSVNGWYTFLNTFSTPQFICQP